MVKGIQGVAPKNKGKTETETEFSVSGFLAKLAKPIKPVYWSRPLSAFHYRKTIV